MLKTQGTETSQGFVKHLLHPSGILCPVCIKAFDGSPVTKKSMDGETLLPVPERNRDGRLVYAFPGGGRLVVWDGIPYTRKAEQQFNRRSYAQKKRYAKAVK